jgi:hypothetical protein
VHKFTALSLISELLKPLLKAVCVLVERDETICERVNTVVVLRESKKALTKRSLGAWRHIIFNVVVAAGGLTVEAAAISTTKTLVLRAVEP